MPTSLWHPEAEMSQISLQLIRVRSLSREAEAAFEPGDTTDISVFSMQLLETAQEKIQNTRHWPRSLPLTGFLPITPCYSKVILPCLRAAAWDAHSQKSLPCFSKTQAEVSLFSDIWYHKPHLMQEISGGSITPESGNLETSCLSAWHCPNIWVIKNWPESLYARKSTIQMWINNSSIFVYKLIYTHLTSAYFLI